MTDLEVRTFLLAANAFALTAALAHIVGVAAHHRWPATEAARAGVIGSSGILMMAAAGMLCRFDHPLADHAAAAAWTIFATVTAWRAVNAWLQPRP